MLPLNNKLNDNAEKAMRMLLPMSMNEDSTWTFIMLADPYYEGALYNIIPPLKLNLLQHQLLLRLQH